MNHVYILYMLEEETLTRYPLAYFDTPEEAEKEFLDQHDKFQYVCPYEQYAVEDGCGDGITYYILAHEKGKIYDDKEGDFVKGWHRLTKFDEEKDKEVVELTEMDMEAFQ